MKSVAFIFSLALLVSCGEDPPVEHFTGDEYFPPPAPGDIIAPRWIPISRFGVMDTPKYDAIIEVVVKGIRDSNDSPTQCKFLTSHRRFRTDRSWTPLPFAFYSVELVTDDATEDLNPLFRETLNFSDKAFSTESISFGVTFTRSKSFQSHWKMVPRLSVENGKESCTALAIVAKSSSVQCQKDWCQIESILVQVDSWRHILNASKPEREKDDLSGIFLRLSNVDSNMEIQGSAYTVPVPDFQ